VTSSEPLDDANAVDMHYRQFFWTRLGGIIALGAFAFSLFEAFDGPQWLIEVIVTQLSTERSFELDAPLAIALQVLGTASLFIALGAATVAVMIWVPIAKRPASDLDGRLRIGLWLLASSLVLHLVLLMLLPMPWYARVTSGIITVASMLCGVLAIGMLVALDYLGQLRRYLFRNR
jgi:hypothetical protein